MKKLLGFFVLMYASLVLGQSATIRVMVADTGVYPHALLQTYLSRNYAKDFVNYPVNPHGDHGTHIAGIVAYGDLRNPDPACPELEIVSCVAMDATDDTFDAMTASVKCYKMAAEMHVDIVNYSGGGNGAIEAELEAIQHLTRSGIKVVVAAGNDGRDDERHPYYPAAYVFPNKINNLIPVINVDTNGTRHSTSNFGKGFATALGTSVLSTTPHNHLANMTGSSQAAAMYTHQLVQQMCKKLHPENKRLQSQKEDDILKTVGGFYDKPSFIPSK